MERNAKNSENAKEVKSNEVDGHSRGIAKPDDIKVAEEKVIKAEINKEQKNKELERSLSEGEKKIADARLRVQNQKQLLERDKKSGKISEQYYDQKMMKIKKVEAAIRDLEKNVSKGKALEEVR